MRNKVIFTIFVVSLLASIFYCFSDLIFIQRPDVSSDLLEGKAGQFTPKEQEFVEPEKIKTTLLAVGDIMLARHVGVKIHRAGDNSLPFLKLKEELSKADITFGNLEAPFYDKASLTSEGMVLKAKPEVIEGLMAAGFDILSLANNHFGDAGKEGMVCTFKHLKENNIKFVGSGNNFEEAHAPAFLDHQNIKFAFLAYDTPAVTPSSYAATASKPGLAFMDIKQLKQDIAKAKEKAEVIIVSMHAGIEYTNQPNQKQKDFARAAIDAGAKLVLGHHPHVVQITEKYKEGFIIYSLGNFVFDQMWSQETREGVMAKCEFENTSLKKIEFIPIKIEDYCQPRLAIDSESKKILNRMGLENIYVEF